MVSAVLSVVFSGVAVFVLIYDRMQAAASLEGRKRLVRRLTGEYRISERQNPFRRLLKKTPLRRLIRHKDRQREIALFESELPACLEVITLGMQAGLGFDQAFALYTERFDTLLAKRCADPLSIWQKGLKSRDEGLRGLAEEVATTSFRHFSSGVLRALRFGSPMAPMLADLADEARKEYRAKREERIAKAPVKMLLPTGALILPAMLLLVMGPILLDLLHKMG